MKRFATVLLLSLLALFVAAPGAFANQYGWTLSSSTTDPYANTGSFIPGVIDVNLWLACSDLDGMAGAEFAIASSTPGNIVLAFTPMNGFLNAGSVVDLLLAVGGCPTGPILAGQWLVLSIVPGEYCLVPDAAGVMGTTDCSLDQQLWPIQQIGFSNNGTLPSCLDELCPQTTSTESNSWGGVKTLFR
ncbi:MAG: hypothetical protein ABIK65_07565 [Candidatus Eisenbacteria bacterium]